MTDVENVAVEYLDVRDFELRHAVDDDATGIVLLTTSLSVEACAIEDQAKGGIFRNLLGVPQECLPVVNSNDPGVDTATFCGVEAPFNFATASDANSRTYGT